MSDDTLGQTIQTIAAFEHRHDTALTEFIREVDHHVRHCSEAFGRNVKLAKEVFPHSIKTSADENESAPGFCPTIRKGNLMQIPRSTRKSLSADRQALRASALGIIDLEAAETQGFVDVAF
jgi:hypothetical protein